METVGDRFFWDHDAWIVGKHAIRFLNAMFDNQEEDSADKVEKAKKSRGGCGVWCCCSDCS